MAIYTYELNNNWVFSEEPKLPGLWYAYKLVKFEDDTDTGIQRNYYKVSIFKQYNVALSTTINGASKTSIPSTFTKWQLQTIWSVGNAVNGKLSVAGKEAKVSTDLIYPYTNSNPVMFTGGASSSGAVPEGFTAFTTATYLLREVEVITSCLGEAEKLQFAVVPMMKHNSQDNVAITGANDSYFMWTQTTASPNGVIQVDRYYAFTLNQGMPAATQTLAHEANRTFDSVYIHIDLADGIIDFAFDGIPYGVNGCKFSVAPLIINANTGNANTLWIEPFEITREELVANNGNYTYHLTDDDRATLFSYADSHGTINATGAIWMNAHFDFTTTFFDAKGAEAHSVLQEGEAGVYLIGRPPRVSGIVYDVNEKTLALTGDQDTLVRFHSTAHFVITAEALDSASIQEVSASNTGGIIAGYEGDFTSVESNIFHLTAIDTRGGTSRVTVEKDWIEYIKLTANIQANEISASGLASITISGNYYGGSFGILNNKLTLYLRYKTSSADYGEWKMITPTLGEGNTYEHTIQLEGLDYMETYTFQAKAVDRLEEILSAEKVVSTIPVFDWGHDDFNFNVPVTIQGKRMGENTILWNGNSKMIATDRAELSEPISAQMNGIVLVFSAASGDVSWNMQYVPKVMVNLLNGGGMAFMMAPNAAMGKFGAKYLYISDDVIEGDVSNETSGTGASAIKFTNADFVLRYVIGV
jgi:hypothetical protein